MDAKEQVDATAAAGHASQTRRQLARLALVSFVVTFAAARVLVYLIMSRRIADLYLYVGQTHVHHLNYGIFLLAATGAWLLFGPRTPRHLRACALLYGVGLALTFDEFGMWLHLGGSYWQRPSLDAVVIVAAVLALFALAPPLARFGRKEAITGALLLLAVAAVASAALDWVQRSQFAPRLEHVENGAPR